MRYFIIIFVLSFSASCFRFNGRITIQNSRKSNLRIETNPIISSSSGGWENGIRYYNKDSIIWVYTLGNNINAKIIQPNSKDYGRYRFDTSQNGIYSMYPNSSFTIGEFNAKKKTIPEINVLNGHFSIRKLIIYIDKDTLVASGDKEIWNLLLSLDKNKANFKENGQRKKVRHWTVSIEE